MKKFVFALLVLVTVLTAGFVYERVFVAHSFGPSSMAAGAVLLGVWIALLFTLVLYETRFREVLAKIWLIVISVSLTYLVVDLTAGYFLITRLSPELIPDEYRHHKLVPDSYARFDQRDFSYIQRVNHLGLRGPEIDIEKSPGTYRILMLGDSFTMGKGVEDDQTFSALLQASLKPEKGSCDAKSVEVLNAGVDSYAPILSLIYLKRELAPLDPDLVVLNLDVSDLLQEMAYRTEAVYGPNGEIVAVPGGQGKTPIVERFRRWIDNHLYMTRLLLFYANKALGHRDLTVRGVVTQANVAVIEHTLAEDSQDRKEQWEDIFESIVQIKNFCEERDIKFLLTVYPWAHQVSDTEWIPGRYEFMPKDSTASDRNAKTVQELAKKNNIEVVSLFPAFRSYEGEAPLYFDHDPHWTTAGHEVMAGGLSDYLEANYSNDWCKREE